MPVSRFTLFRLLHDLIYHNPRNYGSIARNIIRSILVLYSQNSCRLRYFEEDIGFYILPKFRSECEAATAQKDMKRGAPSQSPRTMLDLRMYWYARKRSEECDDLPLRLTYHRVYHIPDILVCCIALGILIILIIMIINDDDDDDEWAHGRCLRNAREPVVVVLLLFLLMIMITMLSVMMIPVLLLL